MGLFTVLSETVSEGEIVSVVCSHCGSYHYQVWSVRPPEWSVVTSIAPSLHTPRVLPFNLNPSRLD